MCQAVLSMTSRSGLDNMSVGGPHLYNNLNGEPNPSRRSVAVRRILQARAGRTRKEYIKQKRGEPCMFERSLLGTQC